MEYGDSSPFSYLEPRSALHLQGPPRVAPPVLVERLIKAEGREPSGPGVHPTGRLAPCRYKDSRKRLIEAEGREPSGPGEQTNRTARAVPLQAFARASHRSGRAQALRSRRANQPDGLRRAATRIRASVSWKRKGASPPVPACKSTGRLAPCRYKDSRKRLIKAEGREPSGPGVHPTGRLAPCRYKDSRKRLIEAEGREPSGPGAQINRTACAVPLQGFAQASHRSGRAQALRSRRANQPDGSRRAATRIRASVS